MTATQEQGSALTSEAESSAPLESVVVSGHFLGSAAQSAMKLDVPVRDTPFAVQSYTESFMKAIETTNVGDLYNYMTGVKRAGNTGYDLTIRGFKTSGTDKNAIMVDGLPGLTGRFGSPPTIGVDHIELVKGPMSVLYGQIQPGGFVNLISKKPRATESAELDVKGTGYEGGGRALGDARGYEVSADLTGPLDAGHRFLFRLIGQYYDRNLFRDFAYEKSQYGAGGLTWNASDATSATLQFEHRKVENNFDVGLAAPRGNIALVAPLAFLMGMPFPIGLKRLSTRDAVAIPWAWGINGTASVLSSMCATLIAVHFGISAVVVSAALLYAIAGWSVLWDCEERRHGRRTPDQAA